MSTEIAPHQRRRGVRKVQTVSIARTRRRHLAIVGAEYPEAVERPANRNECRDGPRPCPLVGCVHNLYLDITQRGSITYNFPLVLPEEMVTSCALDVADLGPHTLEEVGELLNITRERVRQIEDKALHTLLREGELRAYRPDIPAQD